MIDLIIFGAAFIIIGIFLIGAPNSANRLNNSKRQAVLGNDVKPLKDHPTTQRIVGVIPLVAGIVIVVIGITRH